MVIGKSISESGVRSGKIYVMASLSVNLMLGYLDYYYCVSNRGEPDTISEKILLVAGYSICFLQYSALYVFMLQGQLHFFNINNIEEYVLCHANEIIKQLDENHYRVSQKSYIFTTTTHRNIKENLTC